MRIQEIENLTLGKGEGVGSTIVKREGFVKERAQIAKKNRQHVKWRRKSFHIFS
jgi:hypothetical protein